MLLRRKCISWYKTKYVFTMPCDCERFRDPDILSHNRAARMNRLKIFSSLECTFIIYFWMLLWVILCIILNRLLLMILFCRHHCWVYSNPRMASSSELILCVRDHGTVLGGQTNRARCNYCDKVISSFNRLNYHLGGIRGDVVLCLKVHENIQEGFETELLEKRREHHHRKSRRFGNQIFLWRKKPRANWSCLYIRE